MVVSAKNGSIVAVTGSGIRHMSDSLIAFQPAIEEPSNIRPSEKVSSSIMPTSKVTCCHLPRGSVKRRSTYLTSLSLIAFRTSLAVFMKTPLGYRSCDPAAAEPRGKCSIALGAAQDNKRRRRNRHLLALSAGDGAIGAPVGRGDSDQIASRPDSPVRMRMASSILE